MNLKKSVHALIAMAALIVGSAIAFAHNGVEHVMGTVTAITDTSITVETAKKTKVTVMVDTSTTFSHTDMKASMKDLKVGDRVVINAKEGTDKTLLGVSVKWGASSSKKTPANHKI